MSDLQPKEKRVNMGGKIYMILTVSAFLPVFRRQEMDIFSPFCKKFVNSGKCTFTEETSEYK